MNHSEPTGAAIAGKKHMVPGALHAAARALERMQQLETTAITFAMNAITNSRYPDAPAFQPNDNSFKFVY